MAERYGDWIQTFTGRKFYPLDPRPEEIFVEDIAHALARQCRFAGHVKRFYSVAEHSFYVMMFAPDEYKKWGLLHDAAEAYLVDLPQPIKKFMPDYRDFEHKLQIAIAERFGLPYVVTMLNTNYLSPIEPPSIIIIDHRMCRTEALQLMSPLQENWGRDLGEPLDINVSCWNPHAAESHFLSACESLKIE